MASLSVFTIVELLLLGVTITLFIIQFLYYQITYLRPYRKKWQHGKFPKQDERPAISIIVYANNESFNLKENLPSLLNQDYPQYEIIVINDGSTDESDNVLKLFENEYPNLYHTFIPQESKYLSRRKLSLMIGIKAAQYDVLFFIEAKCRPLTNKWLDAMVCNYTPQTTIVLGFCAYRTSRGFFHKFVSYDNLLSGLQYISAAMINRPFSGDGRNLSYRKSLFYEHAGYKHSLSLHAGDDDIFVNESATGENTRVEYTPDSITEMKPFDCFAAWKEMKASRITTRRHFKGNRLAFYRIENLSAAFFLLAVTASVATGLLGNNPLTAGIALLLYLLLYTEKALVLKKLSIMLQQRPFTVWLPFLEIAHLFVDFYVHIFRFFHRKRDYTFTIGGK
jgi:glycosyltransferase involved in cell wall biosynthesis